MPEENEKTENLIDVGEADQEATEINSKSCFSLFCIFPIIIIGSIILLPF